MKSLSYFFTKLVFYIAEFQQKNYIVVSDFYSRWLEVLKLKGKTSCEIIKILKIIFSHLCTSKFVVTDNNPFNSLNSKPFLKMAF